MELFYDGCFWYVSLFNKAITKCGYGKAFESTYINIKTFFGNLGTNVDSIETNGLIKTYMNKRT